MTTDQEIKKYKNYYPELKFEHRKEILESVKYIKKIIPSNWKITDNFLKKNKVDIFVRGGDYKKEKFKTKTIIFKRTKGISSSIIRKKSMKIYKKSKII